jgi:hypothetical protein
MRRSARFGRQFQAAHSSEQQDLSCNMLKKQAPEAMQACKPHVVSCQQVTAGDMHRICCYLGGLCAMQRELGVAVTLT